MRKRRVSVLALIIGLALITASMALAPSPGRAEYDAVRVLLTRLNLTDRMDVVLNGSYMVGDIAFPRDAAIVLSCQNGQIIVYYAGMSFNAGDSVLFKRHAVAPGKENGLRFHLFSGLYCGDLAVSVRDGQLRAVLHIPVEEYLLGVVPYEMSDAFPLEALKAQAIAARTYVVNHMGGGGDYDVYDNTNDQVYRGYHADNTNANAAVAATTGICGLYKGKVAVCYYTASNGGQIELVENVWGAGDYAYIARYDDPYDVENPESAVRRAVLPKAPVDGIVGSAQLTQYLLAQLSEPVAAMGYSGETADIRIVGIDALSAHSPKGGAASRVMTHMRFDLRVQGKKLLAADTDEEANLFVVLDEDSPAPTAQPGTAAQAGAFSDIARVFSLDVPIFTVLEPSLGLSINANDNEIIAVTDGQDAFTVTSRRYGHGVGMSQRGAQWMAAQYGWTYDQILRFYYPGLTFQALDTQGAPLRPVSEALLTTPGPAATATPRPTHMPATGALSQGEWRVAVTQISQNSSLNLREAPNTQSEILRVLYYGQELIAKARTEDGWLHVRTDVIEGYVMEKFVEEVK